MKNKKAKLLTLSLLATLIFTAVAVVSFAGNTDVAEVNGQMYASFAEAVAVAKSGDTIKLLANANYDADNTVTVAKGESLTINLNGKTLTGTSDQTGSNRNMFNANGGTITVKNGTIKYEHVGTNMGWNCSTNIFNVTAGGVLNIDGVTASNLGGSDMAFVAHLNNWGEVTLNVTNSTLKATYVAVRVFNSGSDMNNVTIKNSTLEGAKYAFWVHNFTKADFESYDAAKVEGRLNFDLSGNKYVSTVAPFRLGMTNSVVADEDGNYLVASEWALNYAISNAEGATTVTLNSDITATSTVTIPKDKDITLDLNGFTISMEQATKITANHALIRNYGKLTIKDNAGEGKISYSYTGEATTYSGYSASAVENVQATLVVESGKIESLSTVSNQIKYAINNITNGNAGDSRVVINGGEIYAASGASVRGFANSTSCINSIVINGGSFNAYVQMQDANANANMGELIVYGGSISSVDPTDGSSYAYYIYGNGDVSGITAEIHGGEFNGIVYITGVNAKNTPQASITNGTFCGDVWTCLWDSESNMIDLPCITGGNFASLDLAYVADGYIYVDGVVRKMTSSDAIVGGDSTKQEIEDALAGADNVVIGGDIELGDGETLEIPENTNVFLNGSTITGDVALGNNATLEGGTVEGSVTVDENAENAAIKNVTIKNDVTINASTAVQNSTIQGNVEINSETTINQSTIEGSVNITAPTTVENAEITGDVAINSDATLDGAIITGTVTIEDTSSNVVLKNGTINGGLVIGKNAEAVSAVSFVLRAVSENSIIVENQTINVDGTGNYAITVNEDILVVLKDCIVNLTNGAEFFDPSSIGSVEVAGGKYSVDVTEYLADGYTMVQNSEGMYVCVQTSVDFTPPYISDDGYWVVDGIKTNIKAQGQNGTFGSNGKDGADGKNGVDGKDGASGADGEDGTDGKTPYIGENGNWWIGDEDTGVAATAKSGKGLAIAAIILSIIAILAVAPVYVYPILVKYGVIKKNEKK